MEMVCRHCSRVNGANRPPRGDIHRAQLGHRAFFICADAGLFSFQRMVAGYPDACMVGTINEVRAGDA